MDRSKENSKAAFDRQAAGYDQGACGQHARSLYPLLLVPNWRASHFIRRWTWAAGRER